MADVMACLCGSGRNFADCCGRYLDGGEVAPTAEALMRSRYSAYVLQREDYLLASWHASARPARLGLADDVPTKWIGLEVVHHQQQDAAHALVEFVARYKVHGRAHRLHETSHFVRDGGRWYYLDGELS